MEAQQYERMCRVCLKDVELSKSAEISGANAEVSLIFMIKTLTRVEIAENDGLSQRLCRLCARRVKAAFKTYQDCLESERKWSLVLQERQCKKEEADIEMVVVKTEPSDFFPLEVEIATDCESKVKPEEEAKFLCCMCEFPCNLESDLRAHVQEQHGDVQQQVGKVITSKTVQCEYCLKYFAHKQGHRDHFRRPYQRNDFQCFVCGATFKLQHELRNHERQHQRSPDRFKCQVCDKTFAKKSYLKRHMIVHNPHLKRFQCDFCGRQFAEKSPLTTHLRSHLNIKKFTCALCPKLFGSKSLLDTHMRTHTGHRPFVCSVCGKAYKHNTDLKRHKYEHTNTRPFQCQYCDRSFFQRSNMKVHERVHTGDAPFECQICHQKFKHHTYFKQHLKKKHEGEV